MNIFINKLRFFKSILTFVIFTLAWSILCFVCESHGVTDYYVILVSGFLMILSVALYIAQEQRGGWLLFQLMFLVGITFAIATFVIGGVIGVYVMTDLLTIHDYIVASTIALTTAGFVSIIITKFVGMIFAVKFGMKTLVSLFLLLLSTIYFLYLKIDELDGLMA